MKIVNNELLKPSQNKKGQKTFQLHRFLNPFLQLAVEEKDSKNGAARNFFGPSYFMTALCGYHTFVHNKRIVNRSMAAKKQQLSN